MTYFPSRTQAECMKLLGDLKFSTSTILVEQGFRSDKKNISRFLKPLKDNGLINTIPFGNKKLGRQDSLIHLTPRGATILKNQTGIIPKAPTKKEVSIRSSYFHLINQIRFEMAFKSWAKGRGCFVKLFDRDFDYKGSKRIGDFEYLTRMTLKNRTVIIPDGVCIYRNSERKDFMFILETSMQDSHDAQRVYLQNLGHVQAINEGVPQAKYEYNFSPFVVCAFSHKSTLDAVIKRMNSNKKIKENVGHFLFKTQSDLENDFQNDWLLFNGNKISFYH